MKKRGKILDIAIRYLILLIIGILGTSFFYFIFTSATIYSVYYLLKLFFNASLSVDTITINNSPIQIIGACVAGSAYFLLLILNLSTPKIKSGKRIGAILFSFSSLLIVNILRIFILSILFLSGTSFFDTAHKLFWYVGSIVFVVGIWFLSVSLFKIKEIPFYSDIKSLLQDIKKKH
jgi:exosortase/archaeosortase family protein